MWSFSVVPLVLWPIRMLFNREKWGRWQETTEVLLGNLTSLPQCDIERALQIWAAKFNTLWDMHIKIKTRASTRELAWQGSQLTAPCSAAVSSSTTNCDSAPQSLCLSSNSEVSPPPGSIASHSHQWDYIDQLESCNNDNLKRDEIKISLSMFPGAL